MGGYDIYVTYKNEALDKGVMSFIQAHDAVERATRMFRQFAHYDNVTVKHNGKVVFDCKDAVNR